MHRAGPGAARPHELNGILLLHWTVRAPRVVLRTRLHDGAPHWARGVLACDNGRHYLFMATLGVVNLGFYGFGMPLFVGLVLYKRRTRLSRVENLAKFGFLTMGYEAGGPHQPCHVSHVLRRRR